MPLRAANPGSQERVDRRRCEFDHSQIRTSPMPAGRDTTHAASTRANSVVVKEDYRRVWTTPRFSERLKSSAFAKSLLASGAKC
jgi:hypothetical protein